MKYTTYLRAQSQLSESGPEDSPPDKQTKLDIGQLLGRWINTNTATRNIKEVMLTNDNGDLSLRVLGASDPDPHDWGEVPVKYLFADELDSRTAISFTAEYDFDFQHTELQTNLNLGLMIVTSLNTFKDNIAKSDYFSREYFYQKPISNDEI